MDVAQHSEAVEAELTRFIEKRHDLRGKTEGEQLEEELCEEGELASGSVPQGEGTRSVSSIRRRRPPGTGEEMGAA